MVLRSDDFHVGLNSTRGELSEGDGAPAAAVHPRRNLRGVAARGQPRIVEVRACKEPQGVTHERTANLHRIVRDDVGLRRRQVRIRGDDVRRHVRRGQRPVAVERFRQSVEHVGAGSQERIRSGAGEPAVLRTCTRTDDAHLLDPVERRKHPRAAVLGIRAVEVSSRYAFDQAPRLPYALSFCGLTPGARRSASCPKRSAIGVLDRKSDVM